MKKIFNLKLYPFFSLLLLLTFGQTSNAQPTPAPTPQLPVYGFVPVMGESVNVPGFEHDDLGPPPKVLAELYRQSRATAILCGDGGNWIYAEPNDPGSGPSTYNWALFDACLDPFLIEGKLVIANYFFMVPSWLEGQYDTARYWELQERYTRAWLQRMNERGVFYFIFENEPNMLVRSDKLEYYMDRLKRFYPIAKSVSPYNQVIAGNLSENAAEPGGAWDQLYDLGIKDYSDIIGYHPYSDQRATGINMDDCKKLRALMVNRGDGNKKMFFGEGWGPKRRVPDYGRGSHADPINHGELGSLYDFMVNGYNGLNTYTGDWDPNWLFGALFFTLNDNYGALHWADRAVPHYDGQGIQDGYTVDGIFVGWDIDPHYFNGGLVDFMGHSKVNLLWQFPDGNLVSTPVPSPIPSVIGSNLVVNGDFEAGFSSGVGNSWQKWDNTNTGIWQSSTTAHSGSSSQKFGEDDIGFNGGVKQAVSVQPDRWYLAEAYMTYEQTNYHNPDIFLRACYDPTGQLSDERGMDTFWSQDFTEFGLTPGVWYHWQEVFQAQTNQVSLWFHAGQEWQSPIYFGILDDVSLRECEAPEWASSPTATPTSTATNTPIKTCSLGDTNCDATISPGDALVAFQIYMEVYIITGDEPCDVLCAADYNADGNVTPGDALCIFRAYLEDPC